jgi:hypothetical protein
MALLARVMNSLQGVTSLAAAHPTKFAVFDEDREHSGAVAPGGSSEAPPVFGRCDGWLSRACRGRGRECTEKSCRKSRQQRLDSTR